MAPDYVRQLRWDLMDPGPLSNLLKVATGMEVVKLDS